MAVLAAAISDAQFAFLRGFVHRHSGIVLGEQKRALLQGRLAPRLRALKLPDFGAYCALLDSRPESELDHLVCAVSTNVTAFFREPHHYELLAGKLLPAWLERRRREPARLRLWSAGCATGEEAWALAMVLAEALELEPAQVDARILATDLSPRALAQAREGIYPLDRLAGISESRRHRWLLRGLGPYANRVRVHARLQELVRVQPLNLLHEWPMRGPFDAIFCRNVMIYFDPPTRQRLLQRFAALLAPDGYLFLGHSESTLGLSEAFEPIGRTVYLRRAD